METSSKTHKQYSWRALRPLLWWLILVFLLYGHHTHQRLLEGTRLQFTTTMNGAFVDAQVTMNGKAVATGEKIGLGKHVITVTHPKAEPFTTNLSVWYGPNDLGQINLRRAQGVLSISANPIAQTITVQGDEFSTNLLKTTGMKTSVPTGKYVVQVFYEHWRDSKEVSIQDGVTTVQDFAPRLGAVSLVTIHNDTQYRVWDNSGQEIGSGQFPAIIAGLREGKYRVVAKRGDDERETTIAIIAFTTNQVAVEFNYGAALIESDPPGATVFSAGENRGVTPLTLTDLKPGKFEFELDLKDYETLAGGVEISEQTTNRFQGKLINRRYASAMRSARQYFSNRDFTEAAEFAKEALQFNPDDAEAKRFVAEYQRREQQRIEEQTKRDAERAEVERKRQAIELAKQERQECIAYLNEVFEGMSRTYDNAAQFVSQDMTTTNSVGVAAAGINQALLNVPPAFEVERFNWQQRTNTFLIQAKQRVGIGRRECLIVGAQVAAGETLLRYKVFEYDQPAPVKILGGAVVLSAQTTGPSQDPNVTQARLEQLKRRVVDGISMIRKKIQNANETVQTTQ